MRIEDCKLKIAKLGGFTIIELLVVIAITGILASIAVVNMGRNPDRDVRQEADRLVSFLRDVQNRALAVEYVSGANTSKICGFGVHKNSDSELWIYYIEALDLNADCSSAAIAKTYPGGAGDPYRLETFNFKNEVIIGSFDDLFFLSPHGEVYTGGSSSYDKFPVKVILSKDSVTLSVEIDSSGRIY